MQNYEEWRTDQCLPVVGVVGEVTTEGDKEEVWAWWNIYGGAMTMHLLKLGTLQQILLDMK